MGRVSVLAAAFALLVFGGLLHAQERGVTPTNTSEPTPTLTPTNTAIATATHTPTASSTSTDPAPTPTGDGGSGAYNPEIPTTSDVGMLVMVGLLAGLGALWLRFASRS